MFKLFFLIFTVNPVNAGEPALWYEGVFVEGSALYFFAPKILGEHIKPKPGIRGALGYELLHFRFAVESGFNRVEGTNPLVLNIDLVPLVFKFGYEYPFYKSFGVQADANFGYMFSRVSRYATAVDAVFDNLREDRERHLLAGARVYLTYTPLEFLKAYAGGGFDIIFETDGAIPLPLIEAGVSFKPGMLITRRKNKDININILRR